MNKLTVTENNITVTIKRDDSRIDSRIIATALGIQHESLIKTLETYQAELAAFGVFRFEIGKPSKGTKGGRPEKFAMLNEDQFIFAITLSRNTPQAVAAKQAIVKAFAAARRLISAQTEYLDAYHELHDTAAHMEAAAQQRGSSAPKGACHVWLEKLNNKLLGIPAHSRLNKKQKQLLAVLCGIEKTAADNILRQGGNDKQAYHAAKQAAQDFMRQYGTPLLAESKP